MVHLQSNPEFAALFDRTEAQRQDHRITRERLAAYNPDMDAATIAHHANCYMEVDFYNALSQKADEMAADRTRAVRDLLSEENASYSFHLLREIALLQLENEIQELSKLMPLYLHPDQGEAAHV